jgi:hypothetical protein
VTKLPVIAKLKPGELVYADAAECSLTDDCYIEGWTHVAVRSHKGWVATKYLKFIPGRECVPAAQASRSTSFPLELMAFQSPLK